MKKYSPFICILYITVLSLFSCTKDTSVTVSTVGNIFGIIVDTNGVAVTKALVQSSPPSSQIFSEQNGYYKLPDVVPGTYIISAQKSGIGSGTATISVRAGKSVE